MEFALFFIHFSPQNQCFIHDLVTQYRYNEESNRNQNLGRSSTSRCTSIYTICLVSIRGRINQMANEASRDICAEIKNTQRPVDSACWTKIYLKLAFLPAIDR